MVRRLSGDCSETVRANMCPLLEAGIVIPVVDPRTNLSFGQYEWKYIQLAVKREWNSKLLNKSGTYVAKLIHGSVISTGKIFSCQIFRHILVKIGLREVSQKFSSSSLAEFTIGFCIHSPFLWILPVCSMESSAVKSCESKKQQFLGCKHYLLIH